MQTAFMWLPKIITDVSILIVYMYQVGIMQDIYYYYR